MIESSKNSEIPPKLLEMLNEHTGGGFLLIFIDKNGSPAYLSFADNSAYLRALISYMSDIATGIQTMQKEEMIQFFLGPTYEEGDTTE